MRLKLEIVLGAGLAAAIGSVASAGVMSVPELRIQLLIDGEPAWAANPSGESIPGVGHQFNYQGSAGNSNWALTWDITADPDPFINSVIGLTNNTAVTQHYTLIATLPIAPAIVPSSVMGGSVQGGITANADGGTLATVGGSSLYRAMIDGLFVGAPADLFSHPVSVTVGAFGSDTTGSASFGNPIPSAPGPAALATIGIQLDFTLTPGDLASFTSVFVVDVPAPGSMGVLAVAGLAAARRRRR